MCIECIVFLNGDSDTIMTVSTYGVCLLFPICSLSPYQLRNIKYVKCPQMLYTRYHHKWMVYFSKPCFLFSSCADEICLLCLKNISFKSWPSSTDFQILCQALHCPSDN